MKKSTFAPFCVVCGLPMERGTKHVCSPEAIKRFEAEIRAKNREPKPHEPSYGEQLADGFAMTGDGQ